MSSSSPTDSSEPKRQRKPSHPIERVLAQESKPPSSPSTGSSSSSDDPVTPLHSPSAPSVTSSSTKSTDRPILSSSSKARTLFSTDALPLDVWWFDGRSAKHADWFIDLKGDTTDHLPDVKSYLIAVGSTMLSPSKDIAHKERDQMLLEEGKRFLLEEWERGNGYFLDPDAPGRDYTNVHQTNEMPDFGVAWYADFRGTLELAKDEQAQVAAYGDKGFRYDAPPGYDRHSDPDVIYCGPERESQQPFVRTNLRVPLPWPEHTIPRPGSERWEGLIECLYSYDVHPAVDALNTRDAMDALDCDTQRYLALDYRGFLHFEWTLRFNEYEQLD